MAVEIGDRVGAMQSATDTQVFLYGYGVYDGQHEPPFGPMGMPLETFREQVNAMKAEGKLSPDFKYVNPRITLDNGKVIWGMQCWWGPESAIKAKIGDRQVVTVDPPADWG